MGVRGILVAFALAGCGGTSDVGSGPECEDTATDTYNCGECGHTCWGAACVAGACQPLDVFPGGGVIAKGNIAVGGGGARRLDSYRHLQLGLLVPEGTILEHPAIEGTTVFWIGADGIYACDIEGCPLGPTQVVAAVVGEQSLQFSSLAVTGDAVVFTAPDEFATAPSLRSCTVGACASPATIYTSADVDAAITTVAAEGNILAFAENADVRLCDLDDCQATVRTIGTGIVSFWPNRPPLITVAEGHVAWKEYTVDDHWQDARVLVCTPAECDTPTEIIETTDPAPELNGLTIFDGFVYVGLWTVPGLRRCPFAGCGGEPEPVAWLTSESGLTSGEVTTGPISVSDEFFVITGGAVTR